MQSTALKYFAAVVRCGSIRKAADELHIAPSAVSRQIALLEHRLKTSLFERETNRLILTETGSLVGDYARLCDREHQRLLTAMDDLTHLMRGHVHIATVEAMVSELLPRCLSSFQARHPGITATIAVMGSHDVEESVANDEASFGIAFSPQKRPALQVRASFSQPLQAVMRPDHPIASSARLNLAQLGSFRLALPNTSFGIRMFIDRTAAGLRQAITQSVEANNLETLKGLVRHSDMITVLPPLAVMRDVELGALVAVPLQDELLRSTRIEILSATDRTLPRAAEAVITELAGDIQALRAQAEPKAVKKRASRASAA